MSIFVLNLLYLIYFFLWIPGINRIEIDFGPKCKDILSYLVKNWHSKSLKAVLVYIFVLNLLYFIYSFCGYLAVTEYKLILD